MAKLSADDRRGMPAKDFAEPGKRAFPLNDKTHDRMAISGATRAEHAGNISPAEEDRIKAEARAKLHGGEGAAADEHKAAVSKMHPEHVHRLVQDAHAGKYGPDAQQAAQQAMQPGQGAAQMPPDNDGDEGQSGQDGGQPMSARNIFGRPGAPANQPPVDDGDDDEQAQGMPMGARKIFGRR